MIPLLAVALLLLAPAPGSPTEDAEAPPAIVLQPARFGRVAWGRNTLKLDYRNGASTATSLVLRVRTYYADSASGVFWEVGYPVLLPPAQSGEFSVDFFVRPDHGALRVELEASGGEGVVHREAREFHFEPPYRGDYLLQPSRLGTTGVEWEGRVYPSFLVRESPSFVFYYFPGSEAEKALETIVPQREKILAKLLKDFDVKLPGKTVFFFYPDAETARKLTGHRADGWTYGRTIVEVYGPRRKIDPWHELVHLAASRIGMPPVLFAEGLATAREKSFDNAGKYRATPTDWCRGFLREGALIPLGDLMEDTSFGEDLTRPRIAYPEAACFTDYLEATYGWPKLRQAYAQLVNSPDAAVHEENLASFEKIYGRSLRQAESEWKEYLSRARGSRVPRDLVRKVVVEETVPYRVALGRSMLTSAKNAEAEQELSAAVELDPADLEARFWLAQALHVQGKLAQALEQYEQVIRMGDRTRRMELAWSHVWAGQILDRQGKRDEALAHYRSAQSLDERSEVRLEGRLTTSLEAAREGIAHPFVPAAPEE
ncbi:MAG TPA: tetratricopeptide repeat protein [Candidatus Polarisedimenticolia bacterium]|nr:tetratricopeptide repeat protein [Candidatus Polarisedimenticolia bacterium]